MLQKGVFYDKALSPGAKIFYMALRDHIRPDNGIRAKKIGYAYFRKELGISRNAHNGYKIELESAGLIVVNREGQKHKFELGTINEPWWDGTSWTETDPNPRPSLKKLGSRTSLKKLGSGSKPSPKKLGSAPNPHLKSETVYIDKNIEEVKTVDRTPRRAGGKGRDQNQRPNPNPLGNISPDFLPSGKEFPSDISTWNAFHFVEYWEGLADELGHGLITNHKGMLGKKFKEALAKRENPELLLYAIFWFLRGRGDKLSDRRLGDEPGSPRPAEAWQPEALDFCRHGTFAACLRHGQRFYEEQQRARQHEADHQRREIEKRQRLRRLRERGVARKRNPDLQRARTTLHDNASTLY